MRDMASPSPVHFSVQLPSTQKNSRTSLVNSVGSQRSYGTVKESCSGITSPYNRSSVVEFLTHPVCPDDTLQGIALQYNVTIHAIQRLNNLWGSESVQSRLILKIPLHYSNTSSRSHTPSPTMAKKTENDSQIATSGDHLTNGKDGSNPGNHNEAPVAADEVVRSKLHPQRRHQSSTATCGADGVKSISDILNSADEQLKVSQQFAEKLARRSAALSLPSDVYHRTPDEENLYPSNQSSFEDSSKQIRRNYRKGEISPERMSVSREELENKLFEL